jgi:hypothetical protein
MIGDGRSPGLSLAVNATAGTGACRFLPGSGTVFRRLVLTVSIFVMSFATPLFAQINEEGVRDTNIEQLPMERPVIEYVMLVIFLLAALGVGFYTSKRTND